MLKSIKEHFSTTATEDLGDEIAADDIASSIFLIIVNSFFGVYFLAHQTASTGFFTAEFNTLELVLLYGIIIYWITTSGLMLLGQKHPSRDLDSYGGLFFATVALLWLIIVFPFEFDLFADALPEFLEFLLAWMSNEIALVLLMVLCVGHLIAAGYSLILRLYVRQARRQA
ncbi:MAG: hypothetical protein ACE5OZ_01520 [Candidatus Heimdallarchaeota archaeon]